MAAAEDNNNGQVIRDKSKLDEYLNLARISLKQNQELKRFR